MTEYPNNRRQPSLSLLLFGTGQQRTGAQLLEQIIRDLGLEDISFKIWRYLSEMSGKTLCLKQYCFLKIVKDKNFHFPTKGKNTTFG